jgi:cyclophilin family peptidyl-prolyl cis-trans isomerase
MKRAFVLAALMYAILFISCEKEEPIPALNLTGLVTHATHPDDSNGSISLVVTGGTLPYTFAWSNGSTSRDLIDLPEGLYVVTITDAKNKTLTDSFRVNLMCDLVNIQTTFGNILIWLYDQTPLHKANFFSLTKSGFYDSLTFHRVIDNFVIQGGDPNGNGTGGPGYTIAAEFNTNITHVQGAVGAARDNNPEKRSNGSQFYIVEGATGAHHLDQNYTVFGLVINGMDAVSAIAVVPKDANDKPLTPVYMNKVEVVSYSTAQLMEQFGFSIPKF